MANADKKETYKPFWASKPIDTEIHRKTKRVLVKSINELEEILNKRYASNKFMSFDIETTGLNPIAPDAEIVGYSFAFDSTTGYYVPVAHAMGNNLGVEALQLIYDKMVSIEKTFVANLQFDFVYVEYEGKRFDRNWDMSKVSYYDIFVGLYLADTNIKFPSLKKSAKFWLGWDLDTFEATLGDAWNFKYVDPEDAYDYGCFVGDTLIKTDKGSKYIKDIQVGDMVITSTGYKPVLANLDQGTKEVVKFTLSNGKTFTCTEDHLLLVQHNGYPVWKEAGLCKQGSTNLLEMCDVEKVNLNYIPIYRKIDGKSTRITDHIVEFIKLNINSLSNSEIMNTTFLSIRELKTILREHNIERKSRSFDIKKLNDLDDMYYLLGLCCADASIYDDRFTLELQKKDEDFVRYLKYHFGIDNKILEGTSKSPSSNKVTYTVGFNMCNSEVMEFFHKHYDTRVKSNRRKYNIPKEYFRHFLRGYFDGDGSVGSSTIVIYGNLDILKYFDDIVFDLIGIRAHIKDCDSSISSMTWNLFESILLRDFLYRDSSIYLKRKKYLVDTILVREYSKSSQLGGKSRANNCK